MKVQNHAAVKKSLIFFAMFFVFCFGGLRVDALGGYETKDFLVDIKANEDNTFDVTETIVVNFTEARHGIYRDIPYKHGEVSIKNVNVYGDPHELIRETDIKRAVLRIKIGDPEQYLSGEKTYKLSYTLKLSKDDYDSFDYLYLDLLPTGWESKIAHTKIHLNLPKPIDWDGVEYFAGARGSKLKPDDFVIQQGDRDLSIEAWNIGSYEGLTIMKSLPEGYWQGIEDRSFYIYLLLAILVILPCLTAFLWFRFGRDGQYVKQVEFYPPNDLPPPDLAYLLKGDIDQNDYFSLIPYLANKGHIRVKNEEPGAMVLYLMNDIQEIDEPHYVLSFLESLFPYGETELRSKSISESADATLLRRRSQKFSEARSLFKGQYRESRRIYNKSSKVSRAISYLMLLLNPLMSIFFLGLYLGDFLSSVWLWMIFTFCFGISSGNAIVDRKFRMPIFFKVFYSLLSILCLFFGFYLLYNLFDTYYSGSFVIVPILSFFVSFFFELHMLSRSDFNTNLIGRILGFEEFLRVAEADRLRLLLDENPNYITELLPYAMVFGLTKTWIRHFEGLDMKAPEWYDSNHGRFFDSLAFSELVSSLDSFSSPLRNYDSDGGGDFDSGGSSGGGAGGGGGGSW